MDIFVEFIGGSFVEHNGVVGLVLDCAKAKRMSVSLIRNI